MRLARLIVLSMLFGSAVVACGDDGGGTNPVVDAPIVVDAPPDAPPMLTGLGKRCVLAMQGADCGASLGCLGPLVMGGTTGFCTSQCITDATFMTNAQMVPGPFTPDPTTQNAMCAALYTGTPGVGVCKFLFGRMPAGALAANTNYTIDAGCVIEATAGACPAGTTAQAQTNFCLPN
jgi:hypothetical protein